MKNLNTILNVVLLIAVVALFYMQLSGNESQKTVADKPATEETTDTADTGAVESEVTESYTDIPDTVALPDAQVVYVDVDRIDKEYKEFTDLQGEFERKAKAADKLLRDEGKKLQDDYAKAMQESQYWTNIEREQKAAEFQKRQEELMVKQQSKEQELVEWQRNQNIRVRKKIHTLLSEYKQKYHYDFVLGYMEGGTDVLYANDKLDITNSVLGELNRRYKSGK